MSVTCDRSLVFCGSSGFLYQYSWPTRYNWNIVESGVELFALRLLCLFVCLMVFKATFNNISAISWLSVLFVEETGGPGENHRVVTDKLYHIMVYTSPWSIFELSSVVIGTNCISCCKSNYHTITATTAPFINVDNYWITCKMYIML